MKFLSGVISVLSLQYGVSVAASGATTTTKLRANDINAKLNSDNFNNDRLLKNAIPYNDFKRKLEDGGNDDNQADDNAQYRYQYDDGYKAMQISSRQSVQFNSCMTLTVQNDYVLMDNLIGYTQDGTLSAIQNYVLFNVCTTTDCYYQEDNTNNIFVVDLATFIESIVDFVPQRKQSLCTACQNNQNFCLYDQANDGGNNGNRRLEDFYDYDMNDGGDGIDMETSYLPLDCDECFENDCFQDNDDGDDEGIAEWIRDLAYCRETGSYWQGINVYAGMTCNSDGSGIEIGVFLDQYCSMYTTSINFGSLMQDEDYQYYYQSQDYVKYMFSGFIDCAAEINYLAKNNYLSYMNEYKKALADEAEYQAYLSQKGVSYYTNGDRDFYRDGSTGKWYSYGEVNEVCQNLFGGDYKVRSLGYCGHTQNYKYSYQQKLYANDGDDADDGDNYNQYNYNDNDLSWYEYDLSKKDVRDGALVCQYLAGIYDSGETNNVYDEDASGQRYEYDNRNTRGRGNNRAQGAKSAAYFIMVTFLVAAAIVGIVAMLKVVGRRLKERTKANNRKTPLIMTDAEIS